MGNAAVYSLFALVTLPLWWPALRLVLSEVQAASESEPLAPPAPPPVVTPLPSITPWSTRRTRLEALAAARRQGSSRRWEGGFGRRSI